LAKKSLKKFKKWKPEWKNMSEKIEALKQDKTENTIFYEEIERLKALIGQLAGKEVNSALVSGPSAKEMAEIKEALNKIKEHEALLAKIMKKLAKLKKRANLSDEEFKKVWKEIDKLRSGGFVTES
jgi:predicted SprT family Zn-dependent metalloprotease